ncbi:MAG TPA: sulfatase-like hydrolase/transferase, partial [Thermoanaerobaculia bacterium]|nr:sulfatase-like hydrolase/transferase [Thermoanaerobaculia bacterium]
MTRLAVLALAAAALAGAGCRSDSPEGLPRAPEGTPVVLVSIDTLRSDRLPAYGYAAGDTPALDALAADGIVYERAYIHSPTTLPSHASILTGLLPPDHGVRDNLGYRLEASRLPYLPEILRAAGYRTGGFVSAYVLRSAVGLDAGFDTFDDQVEFRDRQGLGELQRSGRETLARALEWLDSVGDEPFFLFLHIYEPHTPYDPPEPFASRLASPYDGEVAAADRVVGRLVEALEERGLYDRSLLVVLSDHGEGLMDHGEQEHGILLYREALQVPLLVKLPGAERSAVRVAAPAQLVDVVPTVLDLLGLERPGGLPGESLLALETRQGEPRSIYSETYYPRLHLGWSDLASIVRDRHHLIQGPEPELYDLVSDPAETRDVLRDERRAYAALRDALGEIDRELQAPGEVDSETRQKLAALGYVGSAGAAAEGPLPDPKSRLHVLEDLKVGFEHYRARRLEEAAAAFRQVVAEEPGLVDAWEHLAASLKGLGRLDEALEVYQRTLRMTGGAPQVALSTASLLLEMGRYDEAERHAELALPVHESAYDLLAQIALERGDLGEAERRVEQAMQARDARLGPLITLAQLRLEQGRLDEAVAATREAEEAFGRRTDHDTVRGLYFVRGQALARLGEAGAAERAFLREIEISPAALGPYSHLALLRALTGRPAEATAALRQMVEANPSPAAYAEAVRTIRTLGDPAAASALLREALRRWPESPALR